MSAPADTLPIIEALRSLLANDRDLWAYDDIAAYSKLGKTYVANEVTLQPGFPAPIRAMGPKSHPRWVKAEVMAWFEARRGSP